ncbi:hypothetical protein QBC47DRAFT_320599 [Echria macrotheca]|uniref:FAD-binding PCMH-type domain-containing protein n=1 Tax=Echria macrotheca TaxID=438768 RepID=A0AAJ0BH65_9PEZI|nr:hypothetical protein QBC47DRAFT_320599 [Echria macrotheca]
MKSSIFALVSGAFLLASGVSASDELLPLPEEVSAQSDALATASFLDWFTPWVKRTWQGSNYQCKCAPGDYCWPGEWKWQLLNLTVGGNLRVSIPPAASCYNTFQGPLGNLNTYDAAKCAEVTANFADEQYQINHPTAGLWTYFTNDTCRPTTNPSDSCTNGYYPVLYIQAKTIGHIQAGISFARDNNLRLIIRNTGHDFLGRSVGWGALVINTHSFQSISTSNKWNGPGGYSGSTITVGAGVRAKAALQHLHGLNPPKIMVTGECATVGVAGGLVQGGGHGPWTNREGFLADTALQFKVITADGWLRTANAAVNPDLFWALKGGGPASFGVIVEATYKTFTDLPSAAVSLDINTSHTSDINQIWEAIRIFHSYATHWVDNGLYVYYEIFGPMLHVQPFVGINKTQAELQTLIQPLFDDLNTLGVGFSTSNRTYSTFYDLYFDLFEIEAAGSSALTGGWSISKQDHAANATAIVDAFKTMTSSGAILVGHMWNAGGGLPQSQWSKSAVNPVFRNVVDKIISVVPIAGNAPLADKAEAQQRLTYVVDGALRAAAPRGAAYVNEADPFQPEWQTAFWGTNYPELLRLRRKWDPKGVFYAVSTPGTEAWTQIEEGTRLCKKI